MNDTANKTRPEELTSTSDEVETIVFDLKIRCAKTRDGKTKFCSFDGVSIDESSKDQAPEVAVGAPQTDTPSVAAAPRKLSNDVDCSLCEALADALREKVEATVASRRMHPPVGRRSRS